MGSSTGFHGQIDAINFDGLKFTKQLQESCRKLVREAARYWLVNVISRIPIRTGFLAGAFTDLEDLLGINAPKFGSGKTVPLGLKGDKLTALRKKKNSLLDIAVQKSKLERQRHKLYGLQTRANEDKAAIIKAKLDNLSKKIAKLESRLGRSGEAVEALNYLHGLVDKKEAKPFNPQIGHERARYIHEYEEVQKAKEKLSLKDLKDRLKNKGKKDEVKYEKVKKLIRDEVRIFAHKEYYVHYDKSRTLKTPRSGIRFATPTNEIFKEFDEGGVLDQFRSQLEAVAKFKNSQFQDTTTANLDKQLRNATSFFAFNFKVDIRYYTVNDLYGERLGGGGKRKRPSTRQTGMPWLSQQAGALAFYAYLQTNALSKVPKLADFILTRKLYFSGRNVPQTDVSQIGR